MGQSEGAQTLGDRVRAARVHTGLGLRELARRLEKAPSYLSDIENDRRVPSEEVLHALSSELGLDFDELMALAGRFGEQAERYLRRSPTAAVLFRRISESRLGETELLDLIDKVEQMRPRKAPKR
jgi:transcriptional regulator with XRE-family HTH domain